MQHNLKSYLALKQVLKSVKIEVKGDAVRSVASLFTWFDNIEPHIKELDKVEIKPIKEKNKKVKDGTA